MDKGETKNKTDLKQNDEPTQTKRDKDYLYTSTLVLHRRGMRETRQRQDNISK